MEPIETRPLQRLAEGRSRKANRLLEARVRRVAAIRREIISELRTVTDRVRELAFDLRRLDPVPGRPLAPERDSRLLILRVLAAVDEQRRRFVNYGPGQEQEQEQAEVDLLSVFAETLGFLDEARGVLAFCQRCVDKWNFNPQRSGECCGEVCKGLHEYFPGLRGRLGGRRGMSEEDMLEKLIREVEVVPYRVQEPKRWRNYSTFY
ncbi:hypothetical protein GGS20DRAFT_402315 [Poronia punctata]|nr:hypothetical protein GGS20DRAFT_402315 [Poronia punctata]